MRPVYPDDSLAGVPLLWIMKQAEVAGLRFRAANMMRAAMAKKAKKAKKVARKKK
jgi:hypothetical protein